MYSRNSFDGSKCSTCVFSTLPNFPSSFLMVSFKFPFASTCTGGKTPIISVKTKNKTQEILFIFLQFILNLQNNLHAINHTFPLLIFCGRYTYKVYISSSFPKHSFLQTRLIHRFFS